ncbi:glycosyltransferase family 2 protein [Tenacibaculum ovolyticum]|uniref:glycosyltransferase family 2 protein n=1 Tax=Tenacibaculum ovolyticum TaxID=104270 RepID=UPI001F2021F2|nr:glycosyltransferase family 2 protein [Tenacibaculum ovolyticum]
MDKPLISIVIPFYNNETTLLDAIKSVFAQTYQNWELILLNDGSVDTSLKIAKSINDQKVRVVSDGINKGLVFRLNQAPTIAKGNYIARMDADDLMHPERISKQMDVFLSDDLVDLVDTGTYSISEKGEPEGKRGMGPIKYNPKEILGKAMLLHASVVGKKEWYLKNKYNANYVRGEDCELWIRTYKFSKFRRIKEPLYIVREGKINIANYIRAIKTIRKIIYTYGGDILSKNELKKEIIKTYFKAFIYRLFGMFNLQGSLTKRRNEELDLKEKNKLKGIIENIKSINLPM